jgi:hypothetical protein
VSDSWPSLLRSVLRLAPQFDHERPHNDLTPEDTLVSVLVVQCRPLRIVGDSSVLRYTPQVQVMRGVVLTREAVPPSSARFFGRIDLRVSTSSIRFNRTEADHVHPAVDARHES